MPRQTNPMQCPTCNAWTTTQETKRDKNNNIVYRRRKCGNNHNFTTVEHVVAGYIPYNVTKQYRKNDASSKKKI